MTVWFWRAVTSEELETFRQRFVDLFEAHQRDPRIALFSLSAAGAGPWVLITRASLDVAEDLLTGGWRRAFHVLRMNWKLLVGNPDAAKHLGLHNPSRPRIRRRYDSLRGQPARAAQQSQS